MLEPTTVYTPSPARYDSMTYNHVGESGLKLPAVSLGFWHNFGDITPYATMRDIVFTAFDNGITHFDLANNYGPEPGSAEKNCGRLLREYFHHHRDELIISTKAGYEMWLGPYGDLGSRKYLLASLDQSLERLGLDYVDFLPSPHGFLHAARRNHGRVGNRRAKRQGTLRGPEQLRWSDAGKGHRDPR